ncbi:hypothetical protein [Nocardia yunnanensis]|uniref:hypothetical protein n=1 Tax=Nocardia yunnanensis TaxID=2382165 RepID=UPI001FE8D49C|nr:hypothetical protein [Nocardia yunnanensis]
MAGAAGLLVPWAAPLAAICLAVMLVLLFPTNVRGPRESGRQDDAAAPAWPGPGGLPRRLRGSGSLKYLAARSI